MSKYTTELRFICETAAGYDESVGYLSVNEIIEKARPKIFDFDFPIYDESYRPVIETKIIKHYYTREIGAETVGLWKLWLDTRLNEIMPLYNKLYEAEQLKYSPFFDVDVTTEHHGTNTGDETTNTTGKQTTSGADNMTHTGTDTREYNSDSTSSSKVETDDNSWNYYSDTPQGGVNGLSSHRYLTNATNITDDNTVKGTGTSKTNDTDTSVYDTTNTTTYGKVTDDSGTTERVINNTADYTEHVFGKRGAQTYSRLMVEYRESLINIDVMLIDELSDLFFGLW